MSNANTIKLPVYVPIYDPIPDGFRLFPMGKGGFLQGKLVWKRASHDLYVTVLEDVPKYPGTGFARSGVLAPAASGGSYGDAYHYAPEIRNYEPEVAPSGVEGWVWYLAPRGYAWCKIVPGETHPNVQYPARQDLPYVEIRWGHARTGERYAWYYAWPLWQACGDLFGAWYNCPEAFNDRNVVRTAE